MKILKTRVEEESVKERTEATTERIVKKIKMTFSIKLIIPED
jgi:hypothetical protein